MENMDARFDKMERQLGRWAAMIEELKSRATGADAARGKLVEDLRVKHEAARAKVAELRAAGPDRWDRLKAGADQVWAELEDAFVNMRA
jgi:hypothetical protein